MVVWTLLKTVLTSQDRPVHTGANTGPEAILGGRGSQLDRKAHKNRKKRKKHFASIQKCLQKFLDCESKHSTITSNPKTSFLILKCKVGNENCQFDPAWTKSYSFRLHLGYSNRWSSCNSCVGNAVGWTDEGWHVNGSRWVCWLGIYCRSIFLMVPLAVWPLKVCGPLYILRFKKKTICYLNSPAIGIRWDMVLNILKISIFLFAVTLWILLIWKAHGAKHQLKMLTCILKVALKLANVILYWRSCVTALHKTNANHRTSLRVMRNMFGCKLRPGWDIVTGREQHDDGDSGTLTFNLLNDLSRCLDAECSFTS